MSVDNGNKLNTDGVGLSTTVGTESSVTDPNLQAVLAGRGKAKFMQLYLDQATAADPRASLQRRDDGAVRRRVDPREGVPGDHRRRGHPVGPICE